MNPKAPLCALALSALFTSLNAQTTVHSEDFNAGISTWTAVDISDATDQWTATSGYMEMNGFGGSNDEDWLISPALDMDAQTNEYFLFDYLDDFTGSLIELYYSTDYNGGGTSGDVSSATWTAITLRTLDINSISCAHSTVFQHHPAIDVSGIAGTSVYFGFRYTGTSGSSKQYRIDNVHIEADYYDAIISSVPATLNCASLKNALHSITVNQPNRIRYTSSTLYDVWDAIMHTDTRLNDASSATIVWDMFTDIPTGTGEHEFDHCTHRDAGSCPAGEGQCYNREHTFARSWWGGGTTLSDTINTDMHHVFPSDRAMNTAKNNYPPGEVTTATTTGSNGFQVGTNGSYPCGTSYFEPIDEYKGDYARAFFYIVTRYQHNMAAWETQNTRGDCFMDGSTYPSIEPFALTIMLTWHENDPVSQKEIDRNNAVYAIQGNRNPFIDNPTWVGYIWGNAAGTPCNTLILPVELSSFEAIPINNEVHLHWTTASEINSDYFSVERSSDLINWEEIGQVNAHGNSNEEIAYRYIDALPLTGTSYYRLRQFDFDGQEYQSGARTVRLNSILSIAPNPTSGKVTLFGEYDGTIIVSGAMGNNVTGNTTIQRENGKSIIDLSELPASIYLISTGNKVFRVIKR